MLYEKLLQKLREEITRLSSNQNFIHHKWFVEHHLNIVEKIALELCDFHPIADRDIVQAMVWMHDYGKIINFDNQYSTTLELWENFMKRLWFPEDFSKKVIWFIEIMDQHMQLNISKTAIEIQIVSSADWCSHFILNEDIILIEKNVEKYLVNFSNFYLSDSIFSIYFFISSSVAKSEFPEKNS